MVRLVAALSALVLGGCASQRAPEAPPKLVLDSPLTTFLLTGGPSAEALPGAFGDGAEADAYARNGCSDLARARAFDITGRSEEPFGAGAETLARLHLATTLSGPDAPGVVRVRYRATRRLVAEYDARAVGECCAKAGTCGPRMVDEVMFGEGDVYVATTAAPGGSSAMEVLDERARPDVLFRDGIRWQRAASFPTTAFAFQVVKTPAAKPPAPEPHDPE